MNAINNKKTVVVGMSGGVDSSVSALLLKEEGYNVIGMFMKNWEEKDQHGACRSAQDYEDVIAVCEQIGIPYYAVNFVKEYQEHVFSHFLSEFEAGHTPNPDILCNREIKFKLFFNKAMELGADFLATGHYCQKDETNRLLKGEDPGKDQSYFLYTMQEAVLAKVLFPIGALQKREVRRLAQEHRLATAAKKDSTGICFIGKRDFREFLSGYIAARPGNFENLAGKVIGEHGGVAYYTIGQRKGLAIGGPGDAWFVVGKDIARNVVYIEQGEEHPALFADDLVATDLSWVSGKPPGPLPFRCQAKIRYRQADQPCEIVSIGEGKAFVRFAVPQRAITPRQSVVFYQNNCCLGGGIIASAGPSYHLQGLPLNLNLDLDNEGILGRP
jgi:tRNA-specific 2-thiouridylase